MQITLPFGTGCLPINVPEDTFVVKLGDGADSKEPIEAAWQKVRTALMLPIGAPSLPNLLAEKSPKKVVVVFPDITRPMPHAQVLPPLLAVLEEGGCSPDQITLLCATGTHRKASETEMRSLVGHDIFERYEIIQHDAHSPNHKFVGKVDGVDILIERAYVEADLRITTGFVEPHFFAGYSGGPKAVCPGLAHVDTIMAAHSIERIASPHSVWLELDQNPVHTFVSKAVDFCPPSLSIDVTIDSNCNLDQVFVGALPTSHRSACKYVFNHSVVQLEKRFALVISTNAGYPLDQNLYQAVKGMASAQRAVKKGGTILMASACDDGIPNPSPFASILESAQNPSDLIFGPSGQDRWQAQVLGRILETATVRLFARGLSEGDIALAQIRPLQDFQLGIDQALAETTSSPCVLVHGPLVVVNATNS